jgi:glyoxylase-like metal-dependent hydrolase (beta-lactamase superfamily II)
MAGRFVFRQLLSGRDFAAGDPVAAQMVNFAYIIGDRDSGTAALVDPAYAVGELVEAAEALGLRVTDVLATHYHPDHVGGSMMGHSIEGLREILELAPVRVHVQADEAEWVRKATGVGPGELVTHSGGDVVEVGSVRVTLVHTPGHTPGSQCFLVEDRLIAGDTLFLEGCGRTDLPGADPAAMYDSLQLLASLPDDTVLYPGHRYSLASSATMAATKESNYVFRPASAEQWLAMFSR